MDHLLLFLFLLCPLSLTAQTLTPSVTATPTLSFSTPSAIETPSMTPTLSPSERLTQAIKDTQDGIAQLNEEKADTDLEFRHLQRLYIEDLMKDKAAAAKKAGNKKKFAEIMKEISDWDALRTKEWDQDRTLLDNKAHLRQLQRDQARLVDEKLEDKLKERGLSQRLDGLEEGKKLLDQIQALDVQELALEKQLYTARENYDYQKANEIRAKLKDIRDQYGELMKQATEKLKQLKSDTPAKELEQQNL